MLVLTLVYLAWEMAFNARLLDVVGNLESHAKVESIEVWGRLISGFALALVLLGSWLTKLAKQGIPVEVCLQRLPKVLVGCALLMGAVFFAQKMIIDVLVSMSTAEDRRRAAVLVPLTKLIQVGQVEIPSLALGKTDFETAAGKSLLATLPLQALSHPDLFPRLESVGVERFFEAFARQARGQPEQMHEIYAQSVDELVRQYRGPYSEANASYQREVGEKLRQRQAQAWSDYVERLKAKNRRSRPDNIPRFYWSRVRSDVQIAGVPVPNNWRPSDKGGFYAAVANRVRSEALDQFRSQSMAVGAMSVPFEPGMSQSEFLAHPGVLKRWRDSIKAPATVRPVPGLSAAAFDRDVFEKMIEADVRELVRTNYAEVKDYERRGRFYRQGENAYRALIVPPVALVFSLLGAMTHIFKVLAFAVKVFTPVPGRLVAGASAVYLALVILVPLQLTNSVSEQKLFLDLERYAQEHRGTTGAIVAGGIRWATQFQPIFYPVNEFVRTRVLSSPRFDLSPLEALKSTLPSASPAPSSSSRSQP